MKKLLIIDDSKTIRDALKAAVESSGKFLGYYAGSYKEAESLLDRYKFFAAIVDLELPDCGSGDAVRLTLEKKIPTIVLTGTMSIELRNKIVSMPIVDYISKNSIEDINSALFVAESLLMFDKQRALIIDDSETSRSVLKSMFGMLTFEVVEAESADAALEILKNDKNFRVITIDYEMPNKNGIQTLQAIRGLRFKYHPIFFGVSGTNDESVRFGFLKNGANDVFLKPLAKEEFNNKIANAMRLLENQERMSEYIDTIDKHVIISATDKVGTIIYASDAFCAISGYIKEELLGKKHNIVRHPDMPSSVYKELWDTITSGQSWSGELKNLTKDGSHYWVSAKIDPVLDRSGECVGYRAIRQDITDKKIIEQLAITDRLTQIYNRIHLDAVLQREIAASRRRGAPLSIIILDVDKFKSVNDTYGHQVGDSVLKETAIVLKSTVRECDTLGRWGGEEFLIISPNTDIEGAKILAEKLRSAMESFSFATVGQKTASFGVSSYHENDSEESMLKRADEALYRAKEGGRNRVEIEKI